MSQPPKPKIHLSTRRLLARSILPREKCQYDHLNCLPASVAPLFTLPASSSLISVSHYLFVLSRRISHHTPQLSVSDGTILGIIHISIDPKSGTAELSFKALREAERSRYLDEVMPKVFDYVFDALPTKRLRVVMEVENRGARMVVEGLGIRGVYEVEARRVRFEVEKFAWKCRVKGGK